MEDISAPQTPLQDDLVQSEKKQRSPLIFIVIMVLVLQVIIFSVIFYLANRDDAKNEDLQTDQEKVVIGVSLGPLRTERWQKDVDFLVKYGEASGVSVNVLVANEDPELQYEQAESLVLQGVDALIIVPIDSDKIAPIIDIAHDAGIEVIAYDRMINHPDLDYYVSFDSVKVGEYQAQGIIDTISEGNFIYLGGSEIDNNAFLLKEGTFSVIQPYLDSGDIELVLDVFVEAWKTETAYQIIYDYLAAGKKVDAIISANDGMADGAVQALEEFGLAGKVPISGQDAEVTACQRVAEGTQTLTVYKPLSDLANRAMTMAVQAATGDSVETNNTTENSSGANVLSYLLESTPIYKENLMSTIIEDGFHTYEQVYRNIPEDERP